MHFYFYLVFNFKKLMLEFFCFYFCPTSNFYFYGTKNIYKQNMYLNFLFYFSILLSKVFKVEIKIFFFVFGAIFVNVTRGFIMESFSDIESGPYVIIHGNNSIEIINFFTTLNILLNHGKRILQTILIIGLVLIIILSFNSTENTSLAAILQHYKTTYLIST